MIPLKNNWKVFSTTRFEQSSIRVVLEHPMLILATALNFMAGSADAVLAGGRPNAISGGQNAFAGVVNPANAIWVENRVDAGAFIVHQRSSLDNVDNNPRLPPGKIDLDYHAKHLITADLAVHKHLEMMRYESSLSLVTYTTPSYLKLRTKMPWPSAGTGPIFIYDKVQVFSAIFSLKLNKIHSIGFSLDYFYLSHFRNGFQRSDNPLRSVSPGHVTNNGMDHSNGVGLSFGWRWNITQSLTFGAALIKKSYVGQYRKYRGYEPHHGRNYIPETLGAGFTYRFTKRLAGRLEMIWTKLSDLPNANNNVLSDGRLNTNKRGSSRSPGSGLQDATFIHCGLGYHVNSMLSIGAGYSNRIKASKTSNILSHTYRLQTIYHFLSFGVNFKYQQHDFFLTYSHGFKNHTEGFMPLEIGGGKFVAEKETNSFSVAWGYLY